MAGGTLFQMDQTTPENKILFRHLRECRKKSDMDRHFSLCARGHHQKTTQPQGRSLHNITGFESYPI